MVHVRLLFAVLCLGLAAALIAASVAVGDAALPARPLAGDPADVRAAAEFGRGLRAEAAGALPEAAAAYRAAATATSPDVVAVALAAEARVGWLLALPRSLRPAAAWAGGLPAALHAALASALILAGIVLLVTWLARQPLRSGCEVARVAVMGATPGVDEGSVTRAFAERLAHVGQLIRSPSGGGGAIGPVLTVDTILPAGDPSSPVGLLLAGIGSIAARGRSPFGTGEVERALGALRPRRRHQVSAVLRLGGPAPRASASLVDLRAGLTLAEVTLSADEVRALDPQAPAADVLAATLDALAVKVWHALSQASPTVFRPASWHTLERMVRGLEALAEAERGAFAGATSRARRCFDDVVERIEPNYTPALFYRGYAGLLAGDLDGCAADMAAVEARYDESVRTYVTVLAYRFLDLQPRFWLLTRLFLLRRGLRRLGPTGRRLAGRLDPLEADFELHQKLHYVATGGSLAAAARAWASLKANLEKRAADADDVHRWINEIDVGVIAQEEQFETHARIAARPQEHDADEVAKARDILDHFLDPDDLARFAGAMQRLEWQVESAVSRAHLAGLMRDGGVTPPSPDGIHGSLEALRPEPLGALFRPGLERIGELAAGGRYEDALKLAAEIHNRVRAPEPTAAALALLHEVDLVRADLLRRVVFPLWGAVRRARHLLHGDRFLSECRYYRARALYESLDADALLEVVQGGDDRFRRAALHAAAAASPRSETVRAIRRCVVVAARARLLLADRYLTRRGRPSPVRFGRAEDADATLPDVEKMRREASFTLDDDEVLADLRRSRDAGDPRLRAAALTALALLARLREKELREREAVGRRVRATFDLTPREANPFLLLEEAQSLDPTAMPKLELAEYCLSERNPEAARRFARAALRIAPHHPLAAAILTAEG